MDARISFCSLTTVVVLVVIISTGCSSPPSPAQYYRNETLHNLSVGDTASIAMPDGTLDITVRSFDPATGTILLEEKNDGTAPLHYDPLIRVQDWQGGTYTAVYCHADPCPAYVFLTTLAPGETELRDISLPGMFHVPDEARQGNLSLYWEESGQEASRLLIS